MRDHSLLLFPFSFSLPSFSFSSFLPFSFSSLLFPSFLPPSNYSVITNYSGIELCESKLFSQVECSELALIDLFLFTNKVKHNSLFRTKDKYTVLEHSVQSRQMLNFGMFRIFSFFYKTRQIRCFQICESFLGAAAKQNRLFAF